jgi:hypothetical protein
MQRSHISAWRVALLLPLCSFFYYACASTPHSTPEETPPVINTKPKAAPKTPTTSLTPPKTPESTQGESWSVPPGRKGVPATPLYIMGKGIIPAATLENFLVMMNPDVDRKLAKSLAGYYVQEADLEGVNSDVAFAQMCVETGYLRYGNLVTPDMNNFAGLGATGPGRRGEHFPNPETGVRAQIQHLKAYASTAPLINAIVDPRFGYVKRGAAPRIQALTRKWASDHYYGDKIETMLERIYEFAYAGKSEPESLSSPSASSVAVPQIQ